jgi:hypothetical protein
MPTDLGLKTLLTEYGCPDVLSLESSNTERECKDVVADQNSRGGMGIKTFAFDPKLRVCITSKKSADELRSCGGEPLKHWSA